MKNRQEKGEQRVSDRFTIERDLRYTVLRKTKGDRRGTGRTLNMSSKGVLFSTAGVLFPRHRLEVDINWPMLLSRAVELRLVARGRAIRIASGIVAMEIHQYEFRTLGMARSQAHET